MLKLLLKNNINKYQLIHFIGIGGIGMSALAEALKVMGYNIQGSDSSSSYNTERLLKKGIKIFLSHSKSNIKGVDLVVISSAIKETNIEYIEAKNNNIQIIKRADLLAELMKQKISITISGTHGKTTTSSLTSYILHQAKLNPTAIIGGIVTNYNNNFLLGDGDFFVAEADESDGSFLKLPSVISIVTNIEKEHMDYYKTYENLENSFIEYLNKLPFYGFALLCIDDVGIKNILPKLNINYFTYSLIDKNANFLATNIFYNQEYTSFDIIQNINGKQLIYTDFKITLKGSHNVLNSLACFGVAVSLNINPTEIKDALSSFQGIKRRFTEIGTFQGAKVIDDYAHHPTEIKVVIDAATKIIHSTNKVIAVIQPHRYTRLKDNFQEFINVLSTTDYVILLDVYSAGENIIEGYNSNSLKDNLIKIKDKDTVFYLSDSNLLPNILTTIAKKNDIIIFMGAGDITNIAKNFVQL